MRVSDERLERLTKIVPTDGPAMREVHDIIADLQDARQQVAAKDAEIASLDKDRNRWERTAHALGEPLLGNGLLGDCDDRSL